MSTLFKHSLTPHPECHVAAVQLWNYKAAGDLRLELGKRLHVFVGDNGAGKTTVLDGIAAGLAKVAAKAGAKSLGAERVSLRLEKTRRKGGQYAPQSAVVVRLGAGTCVDKFEVQRPNLSVFSDDFFQGPTIPGADAARWFSARWTDAHHLTSDYLPVFAYYTADRAAIPTAPKSKQDVAPKRWEALRGAFGAEASYSDLVTWFSAMERAELYEMRRVGNASYRDPVVDAVRKAVRQMVEGVTTLSFDPTSGHLQVEAKGDAGVDRYSLDELSGGGRVMVALVADLARRMMQANPDHGLDSPAIVLIDELDLHLHPKWQARVIDDLMGTFPNAQFIVSTHSEQIISAIPTELVRAIRTGVDGVRSYRIGDLEGASYDRALEDGMGLDRRRPEPYQNLLDEYRAMVEEGNGETNAALELRSRLDAIYRGKEPELVRLDLVIRRKRARGERP